MLEARNILQALSSYDKWHNNSINVSRRKSHFQICSKIYKHHKLQRNISMHFGSLRMNPFRLCVISLEISFLMTVRNFWSFSIIGNLVCEKNEYFRLQSNFSITFENLVGIKWTNFWSSKVEERENKAYKKLRYSLSLTDVK